MPSRPAPIDNEGLELAVGSLGKAVVGTIAQPVGWAPAMSGLVAGGTALRSERSTALIRIGVTAAVMAIYAISLGIRRSLGPSALVVLSLAAVYSIGCLLFVSDDRGLTYLTRVATLLIDVLLVTLWIQATGGRRSEFWTLYLIVMVAAALRFRLFETLGVAVGVTVLHLTVTMIGVGGLSSSQLIFRPTVMIATAFAVGVLAYQRAEQRRERATLEVLAETTAHELGVERAEVERLRRVDLKRSEFVAIAAHEFRTPLAAIVGVLGTLKAHTDVLERDVREELIDGAAGQAERLARLVDDLLTVSRIEDGILLLTTEPADVRDLISDAQRASGTTGRVHVELRRVARVLCDADAIVRVLTNLLDNARKYSPEGSLIVVSVSQHGDRVRFAVRDRGAGIPIEDRAAIFERFRRLGDGRAPGAGLGLYISRGLVEAHAGTLVVGDAPEGGAEFSFELPAVRRGRSAVTDITVPTATVG
jgi:signal transduction histidine kinase